MGKVKVRAYWRHQISEMREGGQSIVFQKIARGLKRFFDLLCVVGLLPAAALLRLISPISNIRVGYFSADRIGHFAFDLEWHLVNRIRKGNKPKSQEIFFLTGVACNQALLELAKTHLKVSRFARLLYGACTYFPRHPTLLPPARETTGSRDYFGIFADTQPQLLSPKALATIGQSGVCAQLEKQGIEVDGRFVCLIVRDSAYLEAINPARNWDYHSYRDTDIDAYVDIANDLAERGYYVFRMGKSVVGPLCSTHERVIDYANADWRNDSLDLWLIANSVFCISTSTGLDSVADICRKPIAFVNFLPLAYFQTWSPCVVAPSHLVWKATGKKLTLREHLFHSYMRSEDYDRAGIGVLPLKSTEIMKVVLELEQRVLSKWRKTAVESVEQKAFKAIYLQNDGELIRSMEPGVEHEAWSHSLRYRRRPKTGVNQFFSPKAFLSETFLSDNPKFLETP